MAIGDELGLQCLTKIYESSLESSKIQRSFSVEVLGS